MLSRPLRTIHVTSKAELDSALLTADQVIVEGDDQLLSYAAAKASHDPELAAVDIQIAGHSISVGRDAGVSVIYSEDTTIATVGHARSARVAKASPRGALLPFFIGLCVAFATAALVVVYYAFTRSACLGSDQLPACPQLPNPVNPSTPVAPLVVPSSNVPQIVATLAWPAIAIAAILALFLIARQAIAGGRNVEISWKVTEKVSGRVVITKVRSRARSTRSAA